MLSHSITIKAIFNPLIVTIFQAEYSDLSAKYQAVLQMLQDEKLKREAVEREFRGRVEQHHAEIENLKTHHELAVRNDRQTDC